MSRQLTFDLPFRTARGRADYFVSPVNQPAVTAVSDWANWPDNKLVLCGPAGSGKTHLAHVWAQETDAQVVSASALKPENIADIVGRRHRIAVEDADRIFGDAVGEKALFHLHNLLLADGGKLLLTSNRAPAHWPLSLPDLKSRMQGTMLARLSAPDDALLCAVLVKLFADRQIDVAPDVILYLATRTERSFAAVGEVVTALDALALSERRAIGRKLASRVLDEISTGRA